MSYQDGLDKLSRQETYLVRLNLDTLLTGGSYETITLGDIPSTEGYFPCVNNINWIPSRASEDGGLGYLGEVTIKAKDFPYGDQGTFFGRLIASNIYYLNRTIDIYVGFYELGDTFNISNFQKRTYFLKRIDGPDQNGNVTIQAADVLSRLKEAQVPTATAGVLASNMTATETAVFTDIGDTTGFDSGGGYALIEDEIINYSAVVDSTDIVTAARGQGGTEGAAHDAGTPVRNIYQNTGNVVDVIRDIIEDFSDIDHATYLPDTDWNTEKTNYLNSESVELWITEPTSLDEVIDKLCKDSYISLWWDDAAQEIKLKALGPTLSAITEWNDDEHILDAQVRIKRDQKKVLSAVWYFYGKINQTEGNSAENFDSVYINIDTTVETDLGEERVKKLYADSIPDTGSGTASKVTGRLLAQNKEPLEFSCYVDAKDSGIDIGDAVTINTSLIQGTDGSNAATIMRVIEKAQKPNNRYFYKLVKTGQEVGDRYAVIGPNTLGAYASESVANRNNYGFISNNTPEMGNGDDPYLIL